MGFGDILEDVVDTANSVVDKFGNITKEQFRTEFQDDGFIVSERPSADGLGLPSSKVANNRHGAKQKRRLMHWFIPEFGVVKMYVNPQSVTYTESKLINSNLTKGGYVIQYWGEELMKLNIEGTTGSSGVEGLNVLREIYRAEQLSFDAVGLTLASNNQVNGLSDILDSVATSLGSKDGDFSDFIGDAASSILGAVEPTANMLPSNITSLASLALGVELFYDGWVFRGIFKSFSATESVNHNGSFDYRIEFWVTQQRGYRTNYMPWHRSATNGASNNGIGGIPLSFAKDSPIRR